MRNAETAVTSKLATKTRRSDVKSLIIVILSDLLVKGRNWLKGDVRWLKGEVCWLKRGSLIEERSSLIEERSSLVEGRSLQVGGRSSNRGISPQLYRFFVENLAPHRHFPKDPPGSQASATSVAISSFLGGFERQDFFVSWKDWPIPLSRGPPQWAALRRRGLAWHFSSWINERLDQSHDLVGCNCSYNGYHGVVLARNNGYPESQIYDMSPVRPSGGLCTW